MGLDWFEPVHEFAQTTEENKTKQKNPQKIGKEKKNPKKTAVQSESCLPKLKPGIMRTVVYNVKQVVLK